MTEVFEIYLEASIVYRMLWKYRLLDSLGTNCLSVPYAESSEERRSDDAGNIQIKGLL